MAVRPIAPVTWGRRLLGLPRWAPDRFVEDYAAATLPFRVALFLVLWLGVATAGVYTVARAGRLATELPADMARVAASLEEQGVPDNVRTGTRHLLEGFAGHYEVLAAGGRVLVAVSLLGILGEVSAFLMVRRLLGTRASGSS